MANPTEHLKRWREAGLISPELAGEIETWESHQQAASAAPTNEERPGALEALLYLGLVVLGVGVFALFAQQWDELQPWARLTAIGVPVVLLLLTGAALRFSDEPELQRGSQAAWFAAVALFAGFLGVLFEEYDIVSTTDDRTGVLLIASATFALSLVLWVFSPRHAQVLALAGSSFFLAQAIGNWPDEFSRELAGMVALALGVAGVLLAEIEWFTPRATARMFFAALCIAGPFEAGVGDDGHIAFEFLAGAMAAGVIALGVVRGSFLLVLTGVVGAFVVLVTFIFEHFQDDLGAPLALMLCGGVMVAAVLLLAAARKEIQARRQPA